MYHMRWYVIIIQFLIYVTYLNRLCIIKNILLKGKLLLISIKNKKKTENMQIVCDITGSDHLNNNAKTSSQLSRPFYPN